MCLPSGTSDSVFGSLCQPHAEFIGLLEKFFFEFSSYSSFCRKFLTFLILIETVLLLVYLVSVLHAGCPHLSRGNATFISFRELFRDRRWNENRVSGGKGGISSSPFLCLQNVLASYFSSVSFCFFKIETIKPTSEMWDLNKVMCETHSANMCGQ